MNKDAPGDATAPRAHAFSRGAPFDGVDPEHPPDETIPIPTSAVLSWVQTLSDDLPLEPALLRIKQEVGLPKSDQMDQALASLRAQRVDPEQALDDFLGYLYEHTAIDKQQFLSAHTLTDIDISEGVVSEPASSRYHNLGLIDEGGVGKIYIAKDRTLRRKVAIKEIKGRQARKTQARQRFLREAQITAQLDHPNIIPIYSFDIAEDNAVSYAMKLVRGATLSALIETARERQRADPTAEVDALKERLELFVKICDAMSYAHSKNIIHRDLKPDNIMVGRFGEVYIMDWGIARTAANTGSASETTVRVVGTPYYMSPEQAKGITYALTPLSDLYTLGLILFELCTLQRAMAGEKCLDVFSAVLNGKTKDFIHISPSRPLPKDLEAIFDRATKVNPEERYKDVSELAEDVRRFQRGDECAARPDNTFRKVLRWIARHRQLALILFFLSIFALAVAVIWSLNAQKVAVEAAHFRESKIMAWRTRVAGHAAEIDRYLLRVEQMTQHLGRSTTNMLAASSTPPPAEARQAFFFHDDVNSGRAIPADFQWAPAYQMKVSFLHPFYDRAPGLSSEANWPMLERLGRLQRIFWQIFVDNRYTIPHKIDTETKHSVLREDGLPLRWAIIGFETGLFIAYPGATSYPENYDPRVRPWYQAGLRGEGAVVWGKPYYGIQMHLLTLPAVIALYDDDGALQGVANIEIMVERLIKAVLARANAKHVNMAILDSGGNVVTTSRGTITRHATRIDELDLKPYHHPEVVEGIRAKRSGYVELNIDGEMTFIGFQKMPTLGWYYVEETPSASLLMR